ncbi:MAG: protein translocase subunit SecD [Candidatus Marinimicrobia bacterium]|nr:protein translocase subunit SecD [Candidatus Neomarinimicrobiota bacterium]|tara:strand:- start:1363 stop:3279 length:1917 start_codon:yes stop_codon:yes gene_type:complete
MLKKITFRWIAITLVLTFAILKLYPTIQYYNLEEKERANLSVDNPLKYKELKSRAINLGLDLQGGMHVVLEVDMDTLALNVADKQSEELREFIQDCADISSKEEASFFDILEEKAQENSFRLIRYYHKLGTTSDDASVIEELRNRGDQAVGSALEIIRNRVDEFGVSEPVIQRSGHNRIIVELAGVKDPERARNLIRSTALLEFNLVRTSEEFGSIAELIDKKLLEVTDKNSGLENNNSKNSPDQNTVNDSTDVFSQSDDIFSQALVGETDSAEEFTTPDEVLMTNPFSGYLQPTPGGVAVIESEVNKVKQILSMESVKNIMPRQSKFVWSAKTLEIPTEVSTVNLRNLYLVKSTPWLTGGVVDNAIPNFGTSGTENSGQAVVNLSMNTEGARIWSRTTGANIGRNVAIVLDGKVYMAPVIRDRIPGGQTQISGLDDIAEAKDISNVLQAGSLPAPVHIVEERTVGPSLGRDSIDSGIKALAYGFGIIIIFMILIYTGFGILANIAVLLNIGLIIGLLSSLGATLTLPGIAGLILTIGMAVDANVIIFERVREELDAGKTAMAAISSGYERAFITILDANVTTLIAASVLWGIGTGPIKGFAITLSIGILCSMFTSIFVTRTILMLLGSKKPLTKLYI